MGLRGHIGRFDKKIVFVIKNLGLDPDPDTTTAWIRIWIQQNVWIRIR